METVMLEIEPLCFSSDCPSRALFNQIADKWSMMVLAVLDGVSLDIENYCTLRLFFDLSALAGLSRRNLPEAGIRLLFQI